MNHLFQVTVYTGQQLVLEGLQRWLQRPCTEPDLQRQRRTSIKSLVVLLLKTAATGVLATILDAAIEYRRRQLIAAAEDAHNGSGSGSAASRFGTLGLGPLTRAGIAAYKSRLLLAIDEMERHAEQYGIEPTHRFSPRKDPEAVHADTANALAAAVGGGDKAAALMTVISEGTDEAETEARKAAMARTVEQLRELVKLGGEEAERTLDARVDILLDSLLGEGPAAADPLSGVAPLSLPSPGLKPSTSSPRLTTSVSYASVTGLSGSSDEGNAALGPSTCHICMDRAVRVQVLGCQHDLCFQCARRLCDTQDHSVPQCPFCRRSIDGFAACPLPC